MSVLKIGILGCGAIGTALAKHTDKSERFELSYLLDNDMEKCESLLRSLRKSSPQCVLRVADMQGVGIIVEAASQECVRERASNVLDIADLMVMSVGAFSDKELLLSLSKKAEENGKKIYVPSGAIAGLDGIKAAFISGADYVKLTTRKQPKSFAGAPGIEKLGISLGSIRKPTVIFEGTARQASELFPKNINVSMALSLAGIGPDKTKVRIVADPFTEANVHEVTAEGPFGKMTTTVENKPSPGNRKTSYLAALSAIATLKGIADNVKIGT